MTPAGKTLSIADGGRGIASRLSLGRVETVPTYRRHGPIALAPRICTNAPIVVRATLSVARKAYDLDDDALFGLGFEAQGRVMKTEDYAEDPPRAHRKAADGPEGAMTPAI